MIHLNLDQTYQNKTDTGISPAKVGSSRWVNKGTSRNVSVGPADSAFPYSFLEEMCNQGPEGKEAKGRYHKGSALYIPCARLLNMCARLDISLPIELAARSLVPVAAFFSLGGRL